MNLCRSLGADFVISVDLNRELPTAKKTKIPEPSSGITSTLSFLPSQAFPLLEKLQNFPLPVDLSLGKKGEKKEKTPAPPGIPSIISQTIHISQQRLTASRLLIDPPDVDLAPSVSCEPFDFDEKMAKIIIAEGETYVEEKMNVIKEALHAAQQKHH